MTAHRSATDASTGRPPDVQDLGRAVLIQGPALVELAGLIRRGLRDRARDGYRPTTRAATILTAVDRAASRMSPAGREDVPADVDPEQWTSDNRITTAEAARILGLSARQVRRKRDELAGSYIGGALLFDQATVAAHAAQRKDTHQ